jgi:hypothetical protein
MVTPYEGDIELECLMVHAVLTGEFFLCLVLRSIFPENHSLLCDTTDSVREGGEAIPVTGRRWRGC